MYRGQRLFIIAAGTVVITAAPNTIYPSFTRTMGEFGCTDGTEHNQRNVNELSTLMCGVYGTLLSLDVL